MLLLKIPEPISNNEGINYQPPHRSSDALTDEDFGFSNRRETFDDDRNDDFTNELPTIPKEQSISLTIPLSTLNIDSMMQINKSPNQENHANAQQTRFVKIVEQEPTIKGPQSYPQPIEIPLIVPRRHQSSNSGSYMSNMRPQNLNYHVVNATMNHQTNSEQHLRQMILEEQIQQLLDQLQQEQFKQQQQQQQQQQYQQQHLQPQQQTFDLHPIEMSGYSQREPQLWRNTHPSLYQNNSSSASSMLSKLSNSSPDLLIRLKNLLRKSAKLNADKYPAGNYTNDSPDANAQRSSYEQQQNMNQKQTDLFEQFKSENNHIYDQSMLNSFLSDKNISSHEEIKVPFVVIAMPRILSLKRNNGPNSNRQNNTTSISQALLASLIQQALAQNSKNFSQNSNLTSNIANELISSQLINRNTNSTSPMINNNGTNGMQPTTAAILYLPNGNTNGNAISNNFQNNRQHINFISGNNSVTSQTMAPYAQQFVPTEGFKPRQSDQFGIITNSTGNWLALNQSVPSRLPMGLIQSQLNMNTLDMMVNKQSRGYGMDHRKYNQQHQLQRAPIKAHPAYELGQNSDYIEQQLIQDSKPSMTYMNPFLDNYGYNGFKPLSNSYTPFDEHKSQRVYGLPMIDSNNNNYNLQQQQQPLNRDSQTYELIQRLREGLGDHQSISSTRNFVQNERKNPKVMFMIV